MHYPIRVASVAALFLIMLASCQKEIGFDTLPDSGGTTPPVATGTFKAKIDGVQFVAAGASGSMFRGVISITAYKDHKLFAIVLSDTVAQTYTLDQNTASAMAFEDSTDANKNSFVSNQGGDTSKASGKVTITSIDKVKKTISGTFSCKVYRDDDQKQKVITEGSFTVPYTDGLPAAKSTDTFRVKIDATDWTAKSIQAVVSGGFLVVNGSELNLTKIIAFQLPQAIAAGTYDLDLLGNYVGLYLPDGQTPYTAESGKLTVLERNLATRRIRANFNFKATALGGAGTFQLTTGYFSVQY